MLILPSPGIVSARAPLELLYQNMAGITLEGNATSLGGLSAAFDGSAGTYPDVANVSAAACRVGADWGSGKTKTVGKVILRAASGAAFSGASITALTWKLKGSNVSHNDGSATTLRTYSASTGEDVPNAVITIDSGIDESTAYRHHWIEGTGYSGNWHIGELEFFTYQ